MELVELMGHSGGEGRASFASMRWQVEGLGDGGVRHLMMLAAWGDGCACLEELAVSVADLNG